MKEIVLAIITSLIASLIFWLVFSFLPERNRYNKVRPKVEFDIYEIFVALRAYIDIALEINEYGWCFPFDKIEAGRATKEDFEMWLQNKCLNSTFQFDEMGGKLLPVGNDLDVRAKEICHKIDKSATYYAFMSAEEIILLRKISAKVSVYSYTGNADCVVGTMHYKPVVPTITYMAENFCEINKLYLEMEEIVWSYKKIDKSINKYVLGDFLYSKANKQYLLGNYKRCIRIIRKYKSNNKHLKHSLLFKANYCLGKIDEALDALKLALDSTTLKPISIRNLFHDFHIDIQTIDDAVFGELCKRYSSAEILEMIEEIEREKVLIDKAVLTSKEIGSYYEMKLQSEHDKASQRMEKKHKDLERRIQNTATQQS